MELDLKGGQQSSNPPPLDRKTACWCAFSSNHWDWRGLQFVFAYHDWSLASTR